MICHHARWIIHPHNRMINSGWRRRNIPTRMDDPGSRRTVARRKTKDEEENEEECSEHHHRARSKHDVPSAGRLVLDGIRCGFRHRHVPAAKRRVGQPPYPLRWGNVLHITCIPQSHSNCASLLAGVRVSGFHRFIDCFGGSRRAWQGDGIIWWIMWGHSLRRARVRSKLLESLVWDLGVGLIVSTSSDGLRGTGMFARWRHFVVGYVVWGHAVSARCTCVYELT